MYHRVAAADRVPVAFRGEGSGTGVLSWGQREIWLAMVHQRSALPIGGRKPLPPGTSVAEIAEELRYLMTRYPSLRTRLRFPADAPERPTQELFDAGEIDLEIFDVPADGDAEQVAAWVEQRYRLEPFDLAGKWPVRMGVTRQHGAATHMIVIMAHIVSDAGGGMVMLREVQARETGPVPGLQQLEQSRWQHSPEGLRHNDRTLRYWAGVLRRVPTRQLPRPRRPVAPRHWAGELRSCALPIALKELAERTGADSSAVLMALFASTLARITGINPVVIRPVVHNRFRAQLAGVMCMAAQAGCCAVDVADVTLEEAVVRAERATMTASKYAYFDPWAVNDLIAEVARERDPEFDVGTFFNDRRLRKGEDEDALPAATREALEAARAESAFTWTDKQDDPVERLFLHVDDGAERWIQLRVCVDTAYLRPEEASRLVYDMEALAIDAALKDAVATGVPAARAPAAGAPGETAAVASARPGGSVAG